ncbi:hypothetical protein SPSIL_020010 [Sporomusa silvacetica DSM 10669]|uniref:Uncharacterized protein n=1 Tax=Sporomusa silvacetica DSM 10669 TaxID=1123289 RepID=A0ABZ3IJK7_9FIRM|nr:hypothetical protein [Sporomusa silvacetica]OZC18746.1 hypothetical protein SPSIL_23550 [Sporomusa silvacetica DSM 10669]
MKIKKARRLAKNIMFANAIVTDLGDENNFRPAVGFNQDVLNSAACVLHEAGICDKETILKYLNELADEIAKEAGQWLLNEFAKEERQHLY